MSVLPYQTIKALGEHSSWDEMNQVQSGLVWPYNERTVIRGKSFGVSHCGYDVRISLGEKGDRIQLQPNSSILAVTYERIKMPLDLMAIVHDKSSWARMFVCCQNTVLEPGWEGFITLEITTHSEHVTLYDGDPIAQLIFHRLEAPTEKPYTGKYQNQPPVPVEAIVEGS